MEIVLDVYEGKRGCGFRKPGGLYLRTDGPAHDCGKLPILIHVCPTCGAGIKPKIGWTWVDGDSILRGHPCRTPNDCGGCGLARPVGRCGLVWIGTMHYKTPAEFRDEAMRMGISRRIHAVPKGLILGTTWVLLAHRHAVLGNTPDGAATRLPAIFAAFVPQRIEYVVQDADDPAKLTRLANAGVTLVRVHPTHTHAG